MCRFVTVTASVLLGFCLCGCAGDPVRIQAGGTEAVTSFGIDLQDIRNAAGSTVQAMLASPAVAKATAGGRVPALAIGTIVNDSSLNFDIDQVAGRIQEDLLNSGLFAIVAMDAGAVEASRQDAFTSGANAYEAAKADYYLEGKIMELSANNSSTQEKTYTFMLRLNDRNRRTVFQKTVDIAKQQARGGTLGW